MEPTRQERRQVFWVFSGAGVLFAVMVTAATAHATDLPLWGCLASGVLAGAIFAPALHLGFAKLGLYAPPGKTRHSCGVCGEPLPIIRRPHSVRQALLGGWNCPRCGTELDGSDRPIRPA